MRVAALLTVETLKLTKRTPKDCIDSSYFEVQFLFLVTLHNYPSASHRVRVGAPVMVPKPSVPFVQRWMSGYPTGGEGLPLPSVLRCESDASFLHGR